MLDTENNFGTLGLTDLQERRGLAGGGGWGGGDKGEGIGS